MSDTAENSPESVDTPGSIGVIPNPESGAVKHEGAATPDATSKLANLPGASLNKAKQAGQMGASLAGKSSGGGGDAAGSSAGGGIKSAIGGGNSGKADDTSGVRSDLLSLEKNSQPSRNPSEKDFQDKVSDNIKQKARDAVETAQDGIKVARAVGGDVKAGVEVASKAVQHPIKTAKRLGNTAILVGGIVIFQAALAGAFALLIIFAFYKVAVTAKGIVDLTTRPWKIATELRIDTQTATYLAKSVPALAIERQQQGGNKKGVAYAAGLTTAQLENYNLSKLQLNPEMQKMFDAWKGANLEKTFLDTYKAEIVPNGTSSRQVESFQPSAWDLYVDGNKLGDLNDDRSMAFLTTFTKQTMHWDDIYTRVAMRRVGQERFNAKEGKLQLKDVGLDMSASRTNVTKKLVGDSMKPISDKSSVYYKCVIQGGSYCDGLGLGSINSPDNTTQQTAGGMLGIVQNLRQLVYNRLMNQVDTDALGKFADKQAGEIQGQIDDPSKRTSLVAKVSTGASDTILDSVPKELDSQGKPTAYPDPTALLEMYQRFQNATDNGNLGRMMYDRNTNQSVRQSMNYFVGSGQIVNWDMDITNAWSLTDNLSVMENSPIYRHAFSGNSMGVFADGNEKYTKSCQTTFNDLKPVNSAEDYKKRPRNDNVCFSKTQIPVTSEFKNQQKLVKIYDEIEKRNSQFNNSGFFASIGQIVARMGDLLAERAKGEIRTSPLATDKLNIDVNLSPDFDGYSNQIYGVSLTGAETNGEAFETMWSGIEALSSTANIDETYGMGAQYLTDKQVAQSLNKARGIDDIAMSNRSLSDRLFSISNPNSLAGRFAMLTPTNKADGTTKLAGLMSPQNIFSSMASRFIPSTIASSVSASMVNPMNAVRMGYAVDDPSNTMAGDKLWQQYNCEQGGPSQARQTISSDMPFYVPVTTNPCKREKTISTITTCWFSKKDDCSLDGLGSGSTEDSSAIPTSPQPTGQAPSQPVSQADTVVTNGCGGIRVHPSIAANLEALCAAASKDGLNLTGSGWRDTNTQIQLRIAHGCGGSRIYDRTCKGSPPTAVPGRSNHEKGLAIDFKNCSSHGTACYKWLSANAAKFSFYNLPSEAWHWSVDGR